MPIVVPKPRRFYYVTIILLIAGVASSVGCARIKQPKVTKYQTVRASHTRDTETAKAKNDEACDLLASCSDLASVEQILNEALVADSSFGPAHNSLGTLYLHQKKYYLAAWEFEYAVKLMPSQAQPYNNLGLVYEEVGKYDEAVNYYSTAIAHDPNNPELIGNLIRARMLTGDRSQELKLMLSDLALMHSHPEWQRWARDQVELTNFEESSSALPTGWSNRVITLTDEQDANLGSQLPFEEASVLELPFENLNKAMGSRNLTPTELELLPSPRLDNSVHSPTFEQFAPDGGR